MLELAPYINIHTHRSAPNERTIATVGVHPYDAESGKQLTLPDINSKVEAIGEIGLDSTRQVNREVQESVFRQQLHLAHKLQLPVVLHSVRAFEQVCRIIAEYDLKAVIFHGFIGSRQQADFATSKGYFLSFGHRCFTSPKTLDALRNCNINNIFFETDDYPISIEEIYRRASEYRDENIDELRDKIYKNYLKLFGNE